MARLFIFAIGGTGSRVLKSLTMLLASGIKPISDEEFEIVPIIIDPHKTNEDLKRTVRLLDNYQSISKEVGFESGFFGSRITTLDKLVKSKNRLAADFTFNLQRVANTKFKDYIDFNQMDEPNKALADILFSGKSINKRGEEIDLLDLEMDIGFVGNPNIGCVVLNQFQDSAEFKEFANNFNENDRVFIISSIFGGTGAAGFPIVLKNIRDAKNNDEIDGKGFLQNAKIGAITVLPYFNIEKDADSPVQKSDFIAKTRAALYYYKNNIVKNNSVNALYYLSDDYSGKPYKNDPGDEGQKNDAHIIEMLAALAIVDFMEMPDNALECNEGEAINPVYKEFGIKEKSIDIKFSDFEDYTERKISLRLSQMALFRKFLLEHFSSAIEVQAWSNNFPALDRKFADGVFYRTHVMEFMDSFGEWLNEMEQNKRAFAPFNLIADLPSLIKGRTLKHSIFEGKLNYSKIDNNLSEHSKKKEYVSDAQKLMHLFYTSTQEILLEKYGLKN
jgi:hypothetical protein